MMTVSPRRLTNVELDSARSAAEVEATGYSPPTPNPKMACVDTGKTVRLAAMHVLQIHDCEMKNLEKEILKNTSIQLPACSPHPAVADTESFMESLDP